MASSKTAPYIKRNKHATIDYIGGFGLLCVGLGALLPQITLDKGQEEDWFGSLWIRWMAIISVLAIIAFIAWEFTVEHPLVDLRVFRNRNFAVGVFLMMILAGVLYGTTAGLPLFMQTLMGYPALQSGLTQSPRGVAAFLTTFCVGRIVGKIRNRYLLIFGFSLLACSSWMLSSIEFAGERGECDVNGQVVLNGIAISFIFVPLTTATMGGLQQNQIGNASGFYNLMRNLGGSMGIAFVTTMLARGGQAHQALMVGHMTSTDPAFVQQLNAAQHALARQTDPVTATTQAYSMLYQTLNSQASLWAFVDNFRFFCLAALGCIPLVFLFKNCPPARRRGRQDIERFIVASWQAIDRLRRPMKFFCAAIAAIFASACLSVRADLADGINAIVNDKIITYAEVDDFVAPAMAVLRNEYADQPGLFGQKLNDARRDGLETLIENQLILHEFDTKYNGLPDSVVDELVQERIKDRFGDRLTCIKTLQAQGETFEKFRQDVREQYIISQLRYKNLSDEKTIISPYKIQSYYLQHQNDFKVGDQVKIRMIVLNKTSDDDPATRQQANDIVGKIKQGQSFDELISAYSQNKQQRGNDWIETSVMRQELADAADSLKPGQTSGVIETSQNCYILRLDDRRPAHVKPLSDVRGNIEATLRTQIQKRCPAALDRVAEEKSFYPTFLRAGWR